MERRIVPIGAVKPNPENPRVIKDEKFQKLVQSLKDFPQMSEAREIVVNTDMVVLGGNMRLRAMQQAGWTEVPVKIVDWTPEQQREFVIKDNASFGEWDYDALGNMYEPVELEAWGLDLPEFEETKEVEEDEAPEVNEIEPPKSQLGEVYQLGRHRLMCGDSTKQEDVERLMDGKKADMVFTDPPYGVSYASKNEYLNSIARGNRNQTPIENDHMNLEDTSEFVYKAFVQIREILAKRSSYYITAPQGGDLMMMMMMMMQKAGIPLRHCLIWVKNNHVLGRTDYNYKHEPILYGWVDVHDFYGDGEHKFSTWEIDKPLKNDLHPTMKPIALIVNAIRNSTKIDNIVADVFLGSGSTLIACEQTDRTCYGMELDPRYCDVIRKRYWKFVNGTGEGWEEATPVVTQKLQ